MQRRPEKLGFGSNTQSQSSLADCRLSECYSVTSLWENSKRCHYICALLWEVSCHCNGETIPCSHLWSAALFAWYPCLMCYLAHLSLVPLYHKLLIFSANRWLLPPLKTEIFVRFCSPSLSLPQSLFTFALLFCLSLSSPLFFLFYYTQKVCFKIGVCIACAYLFWSGRLHMFPSWIPHVWSTHRSSTSFSLKPAHIPQTPSLCFNNLCLLLLACEL